ncbi:hypothetical protein K439DRAFT_1625207 [Ramaria rubella]|nr:hypothetical protein K439DRAFT_1625207 [Ramaria rubella]
MQMEASLTVKDLWDVVSGIKTGGAGFAKKQAIAKSHIILNVEPSQYPHCHDSDPAVIWNSLRSIHIAHGLGSCVVLMCHFFAMRKDGDQSMRKWVASVQHMAWKLGEVGTTPSQEHIILVLTSGLNDDHSLFPLTVFLHANSGLNMWFSDYSTMSPGFCMLHPLVTHTQWYRSLLQVPRFRPYQEAVPFP